MRTIRTQADPIRKIVIWSPILCCCFGKPSPLSLPLWGRPMPRPSDSELAHPVLLTLTHQPHQISVDNFKRGIDSMTHLRWCLSVWDISDSFGGHICLHYCIFCVADNLLENELPMPLINGLSKIVAFLYFFPLLPETISPLCGIEQRNWELSYNPPTHSWEHGICGRNLNSLTTFRLSIDIPYNHLIRPDLQSDFPT